MGAVDWKHWLVVLLIMVLVFGSRKLRGLGEGLASSIKGFRDVMRDEPGREPGSPPPPILVEDEHGKFQRDSY